ncbi:MAG: AraC family transcriptional regulator [Treponema sp.]|jgi:AraC-like DNA-binding protein|nr:AraC family transcriptional regulator [Treponema sp.]
MECLPFYEKEKRLDHSFPFIAWDSEKPGFWFPFHWHPQVEIVCILKGSVEAIVNGKSEEGGQGDIIVVDSGLIHGYSNPSPAACARIFQFGLEIFSETLADIYEPEASPLFRRTSIVSSHDAVHGRLETLLDGIFEEYQRRQAGRRLAIISKLYELALIFLRDLPTEDAVGGRIKRNNNYERLERIFTFLENNFDDPNLSLEIVAEKTCLNKFYFSRYLKEQTGRSFFEHLSRIRLHHAERRLAETDLPVTDIAYMCGFNSLATFNRIFKTYTGTTPSAYRTGKYCVPRSVNSAISDKKGVRHF